MAFILVPTNLLEDLRAVIGRRLENIFESVQRDIDSLITSPKEGTYSRSDEHVEITYSWKPEGRTIRHKVVVYVPALVRRMGMNDSYAWMLNLAGDVRKCVQTCVRDVPLDDPVPDIFQLSHRVLPETVTVTWRLPMEDD